MDLSVLPSVRHAFETSNIIGTVYARILKFHICIAYERFAEPYLFSFLTDSSLGILALENLVNFVIFRNKHIIGGIVFYKHISSFT